MKLVLDASMTLAWIFSRQRLDEKQRADNVLVTLSDTVSTVPYLWHTEIANALLMGERRQIITEAEIIGFLSKLSKLPIIVDESTPSSRLEQVLALAREHQLTAYGAVYLELALRIDAVLATFDTQLADAMRRAGGRVFGDA